MKIAVVLTCFNRCEKTLMCLRSLYRSLECYNKSHSETPMALTIYLTDDGCTDCTVKAVKQEFANRSIIILQGTGDLYWNGGMRLAWNEAVKSREDYEFYLLLNDDVVLLENVLDDLLNVHTHSLRLYGKAGLYSGITSSKLDMSQITYGGNVWTNRFLGLSRRILPSMQPQSCDFVNANVLLVHRTVVDEIGIFYSGYKHGCADYDFSIQAKKHKFPVFVTSGVCGLCDYDHRSQAEIKNMVLKMTLTERKRYFAHPLHSNRDYLLYVWRNIPLRYPMVYFGRLLNVYVPSLYYKLDFVRKGVAISNTDFKIGK